MGLFKTNTNLLINIRLAEIDDIKSIQNLNHKWTITSLDDIDKEHGFLFCEEYQLEDLIKTVEANEIAVAIFEDNLVGYYINDNYSHLLEKNKLGIEKSKQLGLIMPEARVSKRTQIVVEKEFQRLGLPSAMLDFIKPYLTPKYDFLFSIGRNDNPKRIAHEKAGWKVIYEDEFNYYCIYDLTTNNG